MIEEVYLKKTSEVLASLKVRADVGLNEKQVKLSRAEGGKNILPRGKGRSPFKLFFDRMKEVLVLMLLAAAAVSVALGRWSDAVIIGAALSIDMTLSFAQRWRTERILEKLREHVQPHAQVKRMGTVQTIHAHELVVGDIITVRAGENIPADARVLQSQGLALREATLTGESTDVEKTPSRLHSRTPMSNRRNMLFMGTSVVSGSGVAVVTAVGVRTELGKIAQILKTEKSPPSPLRRKLQQTGVSIGIVVVAAVTALVVVGLILGEDLTTTLLTATTLVVSAIPEDLTMILTVVLAVGVARILKYKGVVRDLSSGETLGAATVICTDKTGTLTKGEMMAESFDLLQGSIISASSPAKGIWQDIAMQGLLLGSDVEASSNHDGSISYVGSTTNRAATAFARRLEWVPEDVKEQWRMLDAISFDARWKYRACLHQHPSQSVNYLFVIGAPDILLDRSSRSLNDKEEPVEISSQRRREMMKQMDALAGEGKRLLAVAVERNIASQEITHDDIHDLMFVGVLLIDDPVRSDVHEVIKETMKAGIAIKIVTGDHPETAKSVARAVGITVPEDSVVTSSMMNNWSDLELREVVGKTTVFARVTPLDKQRIVKALQAQGEIVAMTGDGVNDAVALKSADIGVAMGSGKDVAKEAADLVLLDDSFHTIVAAIREGRVLRDNIRKVVAFLLATNAAEVAIFIVSLLARLPLPLLPAQILWVNLVTDGTSDLALALEPAEKGVMKRGPEDPQRQIIDKNMVYHILTVGLVITVMTMLIYWYSLSELQFTLKHARTMAFTFISVASLLSVWSFRSLKESIWKRGIRGNIWVPISLAVSILMQFLALYVPGFQRLFDTVPLGVKDWALILVAGAVTVIFIDMRKRLVK